MKRRNDSLLEFCFVRVSALFSSNKSLLLLCRTSDCLGVVRKEGFCGALGLKGTRILLTKSKIAYFEDTDLRSFFRIS